MWIAIWSHTLSRFFHCKWLTSYRLDGGLVLAPGHYLSWPDMLTVVKLVWMRVVMLSSCLLNLAFIISPKSQRLLVFTEFLICHVLCIASKQGFSCICWSGVQIRGIIHLLHQQSTWFRSWVCVCLVAWFSYQMIAIPGSKMGLPSWPDP